MSPGSPRLSRNEPQLAARGWGGGSQYADAVDRACEHLLDSVEQFGAELGPARLEDAQRAGSVVEVAEVHVNAAVLQVDEVGLHAVVAAGYECALVAAVGCHRHHAALWPAGAGQQASVGEAAEHVDAARADGYCRLVRQGVDDVGLLDAVLVVGVEDQQRPGCGRHGLLLRRSEAGR